MSIYISKIGQQVFTSLYRQAQDPVDMVAGTDAARLREQKKQIVASESARIAANIATSKSSKPPTVVITSRGSTVGPCTCADNVVPENVNGNSATNTNVEDASSSSTPAGESLALALKQENGHLKNEVYDSKFGNARLKEQLNFKTVECEEYEKQITQREKVIEEIREKYDAERSKSEQQAVTIRRLKGLKANLHHAIDKANIDRVSAQEKCQAEAELRAILETKIHKLEEERESLRKEVENMKQSQVKFMKAAKSQVKMYESENNRLIAQCNRLVDQNGRRRTHIPAEDESKVVDAFYALQGGIRCWCLDVLEVVQKELGDADLEFSKFPLGDRKMQMTLHAEEVQFLIAYVWEWLMKSIFGSEQCKEQQVGRLFDLWTNEETALHLGFLERRISSLQKSGAAHEWRSFTVQCLAETTNLEESPRIASVMSEVYSWLLAVSNLDADESREAIAKLLEDFQKDVVIPAILFSKMLRQRFTPILLKTPEISQDIIEKGFKLNFEYGEDTPGVEIVIRPQLCKENLDLANGDSPKLEILVEAERFRQIVKKDPKMKNSIRVVVAAEDREMPDA